jgi:hypothetical protein
MASVICVHFSQLVDHCVNIGMHTLEEIVSKSTLLCGDRTQENA